jgi:hypothetical protein
LYVDCAVQPQQPDLNEAVEMENKIKRLLQDVGQLEFQLMWSRVKSELPARFQEHLQTKRGISAESVREVGVLLNAKVLEHL